MLYPHGVSEARRDVSVMPAMNVLCARLGVHLTRWVGADGWQALLRRGLDEAVRSGGATSLVIDVNTGLRWTDEASLPQARAACVQVLVGVARVLARFIGVEMALRLMKQGVAPDGGESGSGADHG